MRDRVKLNQHHTIDAKSYREREAACVDSAAHQLHAPNWSFYPHTAFIRRWSMQRSSLIFDVVWYGYYITWVYRKLVKTKPICWLWITYAHIRHSIGNEKLRVIFFRIFGCSDFGTDTFSALVVTSAAKISVFIRRRCPQYLQCEIRWSIDLNVWNPVNIRNKHANTFTREIQQKHVLLLRPPSRYCYR